MAGVRIQSSHLHVANKVLLLLLTTAAVALAAVQVAGIWQLVTRMNIQAEMYASMTTASNDIAWRTFQSSERLWLIYNSTLTISRQLLIQLCADHPTISSAICDNVALWTGHGAYVEDTLLPLLEPKPDEILPPYTQSPVPEPQLLGIADTPAGKLVIANSVLLLVTALAVVSLHRSS